MFEKEIRMVKKLCIVAEDYPDKDHPSYPFVQELAYSLSNEGIECSVIAPQSISRAIVHHEKLRSRVSVDTNPEKKEIRIYRPYTITFSNTNNQIIKLVSSFLFQSAIRRAYKKNGKTDCIYCYFWHVGLMTARTLYKTPADIYVQASECDIDIMPSPKTPEVLNRIKGVVCASRKNYDESLEAGLITETSNAVIVPNGFRRDEFYSIDKVQARNRLGIDKDLFIVAFVGDFNERKGTARLSEAIDRFDDVYSVFIGKGNIPPTCKNILFQGTVPHRELVNYLNCADAFILPTQAEGCCNAIIEAVACGLPVVSSRKSFNNEILDDSYSIRINENSIDEIAGAIKFLKENKDRRIAMGRNAAAASDQFLISRRAGKIAGFISR